jgi:hypothetical protein
VASLFDNAPLVEDENPIRVAHGGDPVRHDDRRPLAHDGAQPRQDFLFGVGVDRRQRIVQDQDARVDDDGARERRPLLLTARQGNPTLADHRVVALRKIGDVLVEPRDGGGGSDLLVTLISRP